MRAIAYIGAIGAIIAMLAMFIISAHRSGYDAGFRAARLECTESALKTAAANKAERLADQEKISKIEADWLATRAEADRLKTLAEVDAAYEADKSGAPSGECPKPGISDRMRDVINGAGRH